MNFKKIIISVIIGIVLILPVSVLAETLIIQPSNADTWINVVAPSPIPAGHKSDFEVGNGSRGLLRFDFSALPEGVYITDAVLNLYYKSKIADPVGRTYWAYEITQTAWTQDPADACIWTKYDGTNFWATAGGDYVITNGASTIMPATFGWVGWNILTLAQHFQTTHNEIANFLIKDEGVSGDTALFWSLERGSDESPKLVITYEPPAECGNNIKEGGEVCDGTDLGGETCVSQGFEGGTLACAVGCGSFDTSGCSYVPPDGHIIPMGTNFSFSAMAYAGQLFTDLAPYLLIIIALPLAFWIIRSVIEINKKKKGLAYQSGKSIGKNPKEKKYREPKLSKREKKDNLL